MSTFKLRNINELLEAPKTAVKSNLSLTTQSISPRTRMHVKQERELEKNNEENEFFEKIADKPLPKVHSKKRRTEPGKENLMKDSMKTKAATTTKKARKRQDSSSSVEFVLETPAPKAKILPKLKAKTTTAKKTLPSNQKRIDAFFQSTTKSAKQPPEQQPPRGRKRLFADEVNKTKKTKTRKKQPLKKEENTTETEVIDLCLQSETDEEQADLEDFDLNHSKGILKKTTEMPLKKPGIKTKQTKKAKGKVTTNVKDKEKSEENFFKDDDTSLDAISLEQKSSNSSIENFHTKPPKPCPHYKIIKGTTFAVDAFRYGKLVGVTHYFLTHFHADHYTGLSKKFEMPVFMSTLTARLVREFIGLDDRFIFELPLNEAVMVDNVEVTALDANHCPGAIIIVFKLPNGECILHTGDFRANHIMESEPIFWNNDIHTLYLDTTYLPKQYSFCTQYESIDRGKAIVEEFKKKHAHKRVLYVCGSYVIGKEKFWSSIAQEFGFKVWTESARRKALKIMKLPELQSIQYVEDAEDADLHVIPLGKLNYHPLYEYFQNFTKIYDVMLALRPSGWEKQSRPRFSSQINVVGIEYSEHSSYNELERFVKFLKPIEVISTVPVGRSLFETSEIPKRWYQYKELLPQTKSHQPSITNFMKIKPKLEPSKIAKAFFVEKDQEKPSAATHKVSPTQSTPMACIGSITSAIDYDKDALDDWLH